MSKFYNCLSYIINSLIFYQKIKKKSFKQASLPKRKAKEQGLDLRFAKKLLKNIMEKSILKAILIVKILERNLLFKFL